MNPVHVFIAFLIFAVSSASSEPRGTCKFSLGADVAQYVPDMNKTCTKAVKDQINKELSASLKYLSMGAYFSQDTVNLPGFAKFFFDSASEEREHGIKLMNYLSMRGELTSVRNLIEFPVLTKYEWKNGLKALEDAIELEQEVTKSIKTVIGKCDNSSTNGLMDYHVSDWLTGEYLEEQYKSQRDLAGKIFSLKQLKNNREESAKDLADFIFDKKLLGIDI